MYLMYIDEETEERERKLYHKHLTALNRKIMNNPTTDFWKSLKKQLIDKKYLSYKQSLCLYKY